ncbi:MAG: ribosome-associated translation inhibitor RaiA [Myxococcota bacterium]
MRFDVVGLHGLDVTEPLRQCAEEKVAKVLNHCDGVSAVMCRLDPGDAHGPKEFQVELVLSVNQASDFVARASGDDLYLAIDAASKKLDRQVRDFQKKRTEHRHGSRAATPPNKDDRP